MNASNPMTPGVYTVELSAFPPAAGQVPTAIPAFIGYTEFATKDGKSLNGVPTMINSLSDYNKYFGGAPEYKFPILNVAKPASGGAPPANTYDFQIGAGYYKIGTAKEEPFLMYNSLRFFYLNGGGPAYIVSVGEYRQFVNGADVARPAADRGDLLNGLALLETIQFPKPTMILIPDALTLSQDDYNVVIQETITQAGELQDRIALLDIWGGDRGLDTSVINDFRDAVGVTFLSYATTYYPWLQTAVVESSEIDFANLYLPAAGDTTNQDIGNIIKGNPFIAKLKVLVGDMDTLESDLLVSSPLTYQGQSSATSYPDWNSAFGASPATTSANLLSDQGTCLAAMYQALFDLSNTGTTPGATGNYSISSPDLKKAIGLLVNPNGSLAKAMFNLAGIEMGLNVTGTPIKNKLSGWGITGTPAGPYPAGMNPAPTADNQFSSVNPQYKAAFSSLLGALNTAITSASTLVMQNNTALSMSNPDYANVMQAVANKVNILPPGPAMAGIYTLVDNTFGVWNAPANINISAVNAPCVILNDDQQAPLNVDALAGKSVNAIRSFFGRGPAIVWGARTLDGNSLDYRYVPVRRTLIMIEQSVANAAFSFVFAPNDSTTWSSVVGMISNFLNNLWQSGGLQGATPKDAYSVQCGLGQTMTSLDILNGVMRVSVQVAMIHPAEFIIITYEQQMAKS